MWLAFGESFYLKVEVIRNPLGPEGFANAIKMPVALFSGQDYAGIIAQNKEYILITFGPGSGVIPGAVMQDPKIAKLMDDIGF